MAERDLSPTSTSSTLSNITVRTDKQADARAMSSASPSISTPPTSLDDEASVLSEITKTEHTLEVYEEAPTLQDLAEAQSSAHDTPGPVNSEGRRSARSSRKSVTTYNVQILAGTAIHTPTKYLEKHHKNVVHGSLEAIALKEKNTSGKRKTFRPKSEAADMDDPVEEQLVSETAQAARRRTSLRGPDLRKEVLVNTVSNGKMPSQGILRRSASDSHLKSLQLSSSKVSLKRSRATLELDDIQTNPIQQEKSFLKPKSKVWLKQGLFVGQYRNFDPRLSESQNRSKRKNKKLGENGTLPLPMFAYERWLNEDPRHVFNDFKLPFDTYSPLPKKVKVDGWVKLHKNRFIGDASSLWKRDKQDASQCYCDPEDGCGEACHNRIMAYECDSTNCPLSMEQCANRPFAELKKRAKGNRYDYGVEVVDTSDRGYGVRAMRTFKPHQIIVEYAGEIITQWECERRMKQVYKKDKCYYLMSFDNKMIIDATRGTIARFVNHSCEPNCEMIKWTVGGEPRMALFAGSRGVMTGEELTYDYNFDPFSQKNIQECHCGTESCRGVLGPKPKKPIEEKLVTSVHSTGTKRKFQDITRVGRAGSLSNQSSPKKRKMHITTSATVKAQNAVVRTEAARARAAREASEHSRQIASRESRALMRSVVEAATKRGRGSRSRTIKATSASFARHSKVSFKHKLSRAGTLGAIKKYPGLKATLPRTTSNLKTQNMLSVSERPHTPTQNACSEGSASEEELSPNITPASLRSASRRSKQQALAEQEHIETYNSVKSRVDRTSASRKRVSIESKTRQHDVSISPRGYRKHKASHETTSQLAQKSSRSQRGR